MRGGSASAAALAVRDVLGNRSIRRIEIAWATGTAADWALLVVLLLVAYDAGGALAAGILGAVRVIPGIVAAPFAPTLVERFRGDRVLTAINAVRSLGALATALVVASGLPIELTFALAAVVAGAGSLVRPIQIRSDAGVRADARRARGRERRVEHRRRNRHLRRPSRSRPARRRHGLGGREPHRGGGVRGCRCGGHRRQVRAGRRRARRDRRRSRRRFRLADAPRVLRRYPGAAVLIGDFVAQIFVRGLLITLVVVASFELLDMGEAGVGLLNAAIGLGGLAGAIGALRLGGGRQLGTVCAIALAGWGLPLILIGAWPVAALALAALFVTGVSNAVLDISGFTLIQRDVRNEDRVTVFGVMEGLLGVGLLLGSLLAPALVAVFGAQGAFVVAGAILPVLALVTWRSIRRTAQRSALAEEHLALLRQNPLFAPLPLTALDRLVESLVPLDYAPGDVVMRKGEPGEHYLLIAEGEVEVSDDENVLRRCGSGDGVGEIALLHRVPRTATVTACTAVRGYGIDAPTFLMAMAGPTCAAVAEALAAARLERRSELARA